MNPDNTTPKCDCTHTQACEVCAESKDIDWSIISSTTPSTGWTYGTVPTKPGYFVIRKHHTYVGLVNCSSPTIDEIVGELNRLHAIDTASEVDVSDEAIEREILRRGTIEAWDKMIGRTYARHFRDLLLPQLAKAKEDASEMQKRLDLSAYVEGEYKLALSASQAEVERLRKAAKGLTRYDVYQDANRVGNINREPDIHGDYVRWDDIETILLNKP